jgi:hypothetical protein
MVLKLIVHQFSVGDVDDPELYAAHPIWEWQQSDAGKWVMEHAVDKPEWHRHVDGTTYGYQYNIVAKLSDADATFFKLKYYDHVNRKRVG